MLRQFIDIFRVAAFFVASFLLAGCSDDKTSAAGELTFLGGDNLFECPAEGGVKDISFFSRFGHWEIVPEDQDAAWIDVWPSYGDDNGRTTLTVAAIEDAYGRDITLNIRTAKGIVGQIQVKQAGWEPSIKPNLASPRIKVDIAGTPVVIEVTSNVDWTATVDQGEEWITIGETTETTQQFLFADNTDQPKRTGQVSFRMVGGDYSVPIAVEQMDGNTSFERAEIVPIARLISEVDLSSGGSFELDANYAVEGWITSDYECKNMPDSVLYMQDASGRGLKFALKDKKEFLTPSAEQEGWFAKDRKIAVHLVGAEFREDSEGNLCVVDFVAASVKRSVNEAPGASIAVSLADMNDLSQYVNTLVCIDPVEFVMPYGGYAPFYERATNSEETTETEWVKNVKAGYKAVFPYHTLAPHLVRDTNGNVVKLYFQRSFTQMYVRNLPSGSGALTALVTKFYGEYILQIRTAEDDGLSADSSTRFSRALMQAGPWPARDAVPVFALGNAGDDSSSIVYSVYDDTRNFDVFPNGTGAIASYYLTTDVRRRHDIPYAEEPEHYYSLNAKLWWNVTTHHSLVSSNNDVGEAFIIRTNTLRNATGDLYLYLSGTSSKGGPGQMKVQWSDTTEEDLTKVQFEDIGTYNAPCINFTPFLFPYSFRLPDSMRGKEQITILVRCASGFTSRLDGSLVAASGTTRLGYIGIVELK
ncbi:DUF5689 domain-containing protein [uncultured Alistipes sp.]|jgi:lipoprotein|uniref:DUF5689 domain-containing protein n=1 Tax=uncultured Alistipes sp. TaxID=538949 RepID=UPI0025FEA1BA|nr:DUF5689 domain-containing protein [uncultured Alistipes sp.]